MNTVRDALTLCGINNVQLWNGRTKAQRISSNIFGDDFATAKDLDYDDILDDFKTYSALTVANGQIRLTPGNKRNVRALIQWIKHQYRKGLNPAATPFPVADTHALLRQEQTHLKFMKKSKTIVESAKPGRLTLEMKWHDWKPTFINFLRSIPGRDGVPLSYVVRANDAPDPTPNLDFLDDYVAMAPLVGETFAVDSNEVHTYIVKFITGNHVAESKIQPRLTDTDGRVDFKLLVAHYEGVGINSVDVLRAERIIETLHYSGEKRSHTCGGPNSKFSLTSPSRPCRKMRTDRCTRSE